MDKQELIELTNKIYKLSLLFPKKEPLRYKIREAADNILADFIAEPNKVQKNMEILKSYFGLIKLQGWVNYFDILDLEKEYSQIEISRGRASGDFPEVRLGTRKERILEILKEKENIQVGEVSRIMPEVSKRTLRRDFEQLLKQGRIERMGEKNNTFYKLR